MSEVGEEWSLKRAMEELADVDLGYNEPLFYMPRACSCVHFTWAIVDCKYSPGNLVQSGIAKSGQGVVVTSIRPEWVSLRVRSPSFIPFEMKVHKSTEEVSIRTYRDTLIGWQCTCNSKSGK